MIVKTDGSFAALAITPCLRQGGGLGSLSALSSRLPSHLSLGSGSLTPAPTTPASLWPAPAPAQRSVTPLLFPEHQLRPQPQPRQHCRDHQQRPSYIIHTLVESFDFLQISIC